jgi:dTDP-4-dehydrorhamnose 3,5-epimerase-like enzyme
LRKPIKSSTLAFSQKGLKTVLSASLINLPKISDKRGNLSVIEQNKHIPFDIQRVFYLYDIATGESRGGHAHKDCHQFLIALNGSFEVLVDDGTTKKTIALTEPHQGLHIPPMIWAEELNFSQGAICLVLASLPYDESDYIRSYSDFLQNIL